MLPDASALGLEINERDHVRHGNILEEICKRGKNASKITRLSAYIRTLPEDKVTKYFALIREGWPPFAWTLRNPDARDRPAGGAIPDRAPVRACSSVPKPCGGSAKHRQ
jgi:hypothetical protein